MLEVGAASFETSLRLKQLNPKAKIAAIESSPERAISSEVIDIIIDDFSGHDFHGLFDVIFSNQVVDDLSPFIHPVGCRARTSIEPCWLGDATGRGAEPQVSSSDPSRCFAGSLRLA